MKTNWQTKKLGEICKISTGKSNANEAVENGVYAFFDRSKIIKKSNRFLFNCEALIIPGEGAQFFPRYYSCKFDLHQRAYALFNFDKNIDIRFIEYYLIFNHKYFERVAVGATVKSLRLRHFQELEIPIPPLPEQKRIVKILDGVFGEVKKAKENAEKNLANAKELFESVLEDTFKNDKLKIINDEWEEKKLGEVCKKTENIKWKEHKGKEFNYVDLSAVSRDNLKIENSVIINYKNAPSRAKKIIKTDDIIFATTRPTLKRIAKIYSDFNNQICSTGFVVLRAKKDKIISNIIYYFLQTNTFIDSMEKLQRGANYPAVSDNDVKNQIFKFPKSLKTQKQIVKKLDELSGQTKKLEKVYQQKIDDLDELKKSILQKAFFKEL